MRVAQVVQQAYLVTDRLGRKLWNPVGSTTFHNVQSASQYVSRILT